MSQTDHSSCDSIPESESMLENDCEDIHGISNVKCSFEPYQGEPFAMASDEESSEDEADKTAFNRLFWSSVWIKLF